MKTVLALTFSLFLGAAAYGQNPPPQTPPAQEQDQQAVTVTGCLTKAPTAGDYVIKDSKTGEKLIFAGPDRLDQYLNHTVQLTGKMLTQSGEKAFQPQSIRTVSASCEGADNR
jgi:hypothetical protein